MRKTYEAVCTTCYTSVICTATKKADANRAATAHMASFGHNVCILTTPTHYIEVHGRKRYFKTLVAATVAANAIHRATGIVVGIFVTPD